MLGAIDGLPNGTFQPSGTLTRAQFCKMAVVTMGRESGVALYQNRTIFPDTPGIHWASGYINMAVSTSVSDESSFGIITGYPDGTFRPDISISYAQAVTILMRMLGYADSDAGMIWPDGYLAAAGKIGLTDGLSLSPSSEITRAQAARLFCNLLRTPVKDSTNNVY